MPCCNLIPAPRNILRAVVNASNDIASYAHFLGPETLITDLTYSDPKGPAKSFSEALVWTERQCPTATIGTYFSSRCVAAPEANREPVGTLAPEIFDESELLPTTFLDDGRRIIDYRQPATRQKLIRLIVDQAVRYKTPCLFTDNWSHAASWPGYISWAETLVYMAELTAELHGYGIAHVPNVAIALGTAEIPQSDITGLGASCDGVGLEMAALPSVIAEGGGVGRLIASYQVLSQAHCRAILIPAKGVAGTPEYAAEAQFLAGLAMVTGDHYCAWQFWLPQQEWYWWPARLGRPFGEASRNGAMASREFERGTVTVDFKGRVAAVS